MISKTTTFLASWSFKKMAVHSVWQETSIRLDRIKTDVHLGKIHSWSLLHATTHFSGRQLFLCWIKPACICIPSDCMIHL